MKNAIGAVLLSLTFSLVLSRETPPWAFRPSNQRRGGPLPGYLPLLPVPPSPPSRHPRWHWPRPAETVSRPVYARPPPQHYEKFPPYWDDSSSNSKHRFKSPKSFKKDCGPCNSVPWTPIFKSPPHVPSVEVYPESSNQLPAVLPPEKNVLLPAGNTPISLNLLFPPKAPVVPLHQPVPFFAEPDGLVPPIAPPKASSVVDVTISEPKPPENVFITPDQHQESSSYISNSHQYLPQIPQVDVVRSVPLAEYTSSIEYPLHVIQSGPYIDIAIPNNATTPRPVYNPPPPPPPPATSTQDYQKVSDFILNVGKDLKKINDNEASGSKVSEILETATQQEPHRSRQNGIFREEANLLSPPPVPPQLTQLLPTFDSSYFNSDLASIVNGGLIPSPASPQLHPQSSKKIQIIIPYTTITAHDANSVENINVTNIQVNPETLNTWMPVVVTESNLPGVKPEIITDPTIPRKVPEETAAAMHVQHILAHNIRDLLQKEMQKPEQNIRLQKNIDNWTALGYSNHQVVAKKRPDDVITHAQTVTMSPGTSISHFLFQSKKIPDGYLTSTTEKPHEEPSTVNDNLSFSVNSLSFTPTTKRSKVFKISTRQLNRIRSTTTTTTTTSKPREDEEISESANWSDVKVSIAPGTNEKVYVVTPSNWGAKRTTRHAEDTTEDTPKFNFTQLEQVAEVKSKSKAKLLHPKSTPLFRVKGNHSRSDLLPKLNKPKPIEKFFATTTKPLTSSTVPSKTTARPTTENTQDLFTNAVFPFRNGGEVPVEMAQNVTVEDVKFKGFGERKTLVKQTNLNIRKPTNANDESVQVPKLEVDVVLPYNKYNGTKKGEHKKATDIAKKKHHDKINPDEPNITEDDREKINKLKQESSSEMLQAVETKTFPINQTLNLQDTIIALKELLNETNEKPELSKIVEKMEDEKEKYNFPEYLVGELNLSKEEINLIESAMVEIRKKKLKT